MAGVNVNEEFVGLNGIVAVGTFGAAVAPTSATSTLDASWADLGLTTEAGVTRSEPMTADVRRAWQNRVKLRTLVTEFAVRWSFVLVQTSADVVKLFHGTAVDSSGAVVITDAEKPIIAFDLDIIDGAQIIREYAPRARLVEIGDQVAVSGDTFGWPVTIEAEYDATLGGYTKRWFSSVAGVPRLSSALPTAVAQGGQVKISGTGFFKNGVADVSGAASVKFGATNATSYIVDDNETIYAVMPAGSAGVANVTVTNSNGVSTALSYTRGA